MDDFLRRIGASMSEREAFGPTLRRTRIQRGISLDHISDATKVSPDIWGGLERNDFSRWPSGIYARAYIRAYALEIGVDPDATVNDFCRWFPQGDRRAARVVKAQAAIVGHDLQWKDDIAPGLRDRRAQAPEPVKDGPAAAFTRRGRLTAAGGDLAAIVTLSTLVKALAPIGWLAAVAGIAAVYHTVALVSIGSSPAVWALVTYLESRHPETQRRQTAPRLLRLAERHGRT
jgi:transcriptional regulator with XRE-family HTH domain